MILKPPWELAISEGLIRLNDLMVWCWMILKFIPVLNFILPSLFSWWDIGGTSPWFGDLCSITHSWCSVEFRSIKEVHKHMELGWSRTENTQASCWAPTKYSLKRYRPGDVRSSDLTVSWKSGFYLCYKRTVFLNIIKEHKELSFLKSCMNHKKYISTGQVRSIHGHFAVRHGVRWLGPHRPSNSFKLSLGRVFFSITDQSTLWCFHFTTVKQGSMHEGSF